MVIKCTASTKMRNLNRFKPDYTGFYRIKTCGLFLCIVLNFFVFLLFCCIPLLPMATMLSFLQTFSDDRGVKIKINWPKTKSELPSRLFTFHSFRILTNMWGAQPDFQTFLRPCFKAASGKVNTYYRNRIFRKVLL